MGSPLPTAAKNRYKTDPFYLGTGRGGAGASSKLISIENDEGGEEAYATAGGARQLHSSSSLSLSRGALVDDLRDNYYDAPPASIGGGGDGGIDSFDEGGFRRGSKAGKGRKSKDKGRRGRDGLKVGSGGGQGGYAVDNAEVGHSLNLE